MKQVFAKTTERFVLSAKIADDKQKLFVDIEPIGGHVITRDQLVSVIKEFAPAADLHTGVLDDIAAHLSKGEKVEERRIAKGTPAEDGADGKVLLLVKKLSSEAELKLDKRGYADYREMHLFDNVQKGQIVGRVYHPKAGTPGVDAMGIRIEPKPGKPAKVTLDKTVALEPAKDSAHDFETLVALDDGYLTDQEGRIAIKTELLIKDDLDYRYGTIDFVGVVKVNGDVLPGFNIKAQKGIEITGSVRGGSLICPDGDIIVRGFVFGGENSRVISGRSFTATVVQEINAEIIGNITILKESINSNLRTESSIFIPAGQLVGGTAMAVCGVEAKRIGNEAGQVTKIRLCSDIETHTEFSKLQALLESYQHAKRMLEVHLGPYAQAPQRIQLLKGSHHEKISKLWSKLQEVEQGIATIVEKKKVMLDKAKKNDVMRVNYLSACYEGVVIEAGEEKFSPDKELHGPGSIDFTVADNKFLLGEMKPLVCTVHPESDPSNKEGAKKDDSKQRSKKSN